MQLRQLETFIAIVDTGTLTAAAAQLYKTQGAVSQDLKTLESSLGVQLVNRSGQRARLTTAGRALLPMARRILAEVADARAEMERIKAGESPVVRLTCLPSLGPTISHLLAEYTHGQPDVRWSLVTSLRGAMITGLRDGQFDLAICESQNDEDITNTPLMREPLHLVLPRDHPLLDQTPVRPSDLVGLPYIGLLRSMGASIEAQRFFAAGESYPTPVVEVNDTHLVSALVADLGGFGFVPASVATDDRPVVTAETDPDLTRQISLAQLTNRTLPPVAAAFATYLTQRWSFL
ncbi:LysR family transcriptional regulator [Nocardia vaccinii]|uniref:LysR family transcriptional regulator n=1 Tax=Nocardia vaccinii TaxID=1822 RepID=UPI00082DBBE5|nr:LysR family transcriptional regulator [Nocardia vaccinii]